MTVTNKTGAGSYAAEIERSLGAERVARSRGWAEEWVRAGFGRDALREGDRAPRFSLPDQFGEPVALDALLRQGPALVTFYRGGWCPYCNLQLRLYQRILPQIRAFGAGLVAISPELPNHTLSTAEKNDLSFPVLSDTGNQVARAFGLVFRVDDETRQRYLSNGNDLASINGDASWELPVTGSFIIDQSGLVRRAFAHADYTQRLEPETILADLRELAWRASGLG